MLKFTANDLLTKHYEKITIYGYGHSSYAHSSNQLSVKVRFNFLYSDEMGGKYGFTIPGYFAYDDIAVRFEK